MVAENDTALESAGKTLFNMNSDYLTRERARAREDYERNERTHERREAMLLAELAEKNEALEEQKKENEALRRELEKFKGNS